MKLLLDTHILLWALADHPSLSAAHRRAIEGQDAELYISAVSIWEIAIKRALGKLNAPDDLAEVAQSAGCRPLSISMKHAEAAGALPPHHAEPFDRMLIAQAQCEGLTLVTADRAFQRYDVTCL